LANDTEYGLAAYFYARDLGRVWRVAEALEYGIVGINEGIISTEVAPFGGIKESGIGREGSRYGIEDFLEVNTWRWAAWRRSNANNQGRVMSICRWSDDESDVYVTYRDDNLLCCYSCRFSPDALAFEAHGADEMISHLHAHPKSGRQKYQTRHSKGWQRTYRIHLDQLH